MDNGKGWMPKHLKSSRQISSFEIEEFFTFIGGILAFLMFKHKLWLLAAVVGYYIVVKIKEKYPKGILFNIAYVSGLLDLEGYPPGLTKEFIE